MWVVSSMMYSCLMPTPTPLLLNHGAGALHALCHRTNEWLLHLESVLVHPWKQWPQYHYVCLSLLRSHLFLCQSNWTPWRILTSLFSTSLNQVGKKVGGGGCERVLCGESCCNPCEAYQDPGRVFGEVSLALSLSFKALSPLVHLRTCECVCAIKLTTERSALCVPQKPWVVINIDECWIVYVSFHWDLCSMVAHKDFVCSICV